MVWRITLKDEFHLSWLRAVHLYFLQCLVVLRIRGLSHILDAPCQAYKEEKDGDKVTFSIEYFTSLTHSLQLESDSIYIVTVLV